MTRAKKNLLAVTFIAMLVTVSFAMTGVISTSAIVKGWQNEDLPEGNMRQAPLDIKIVFIGIRQAHVNTSDGYFQWNLEPYHIQGETWYGTDWGVNHTFRYSYSFNQTFDNQFFDYLHFGPGVRKDAQLVNPYLGPIPGAWYRFYNANKVEDWLYNNPQGYGGIPTNGYTLFLINVTYRDGYPHENPPLGRTHYYNLTYSDIDSTGIVTDGLYYGQWMTSWGGHHRLYFIDVSAGVSPPLLASLGSYWWNHYFQPVWSPNLNFDLTKKSDINLLNEYLASFVFGAVYGAFTNDFLYPPRIAPNLNYNITITIFDNCTNFYGKLLYIPGGTHPPYLGSYGVTKQRILQSFQQLVPYATWNVNLTYVHLNGTTDNEPYHTLWSVIKNAQRTATDVYGNPVVYVDRDQLYHHLQEHLSDFVTPQTEQLVIPVFAFAFDTPYNLGYQYEGYEYDYYWGFAYPDVVLVSHSLKDLTGIGGGVAKGFTQTIIHEVGHAVGLAHPFWWDWDEDFVASAMAYYPYEYAFSQFDKDAIQRGHADYYIIRAQSMMENATELKAWKQMTPALLESYNHAYGNLTQALTYYGAMNYDGSRSDARTALDLFTQFVDGATLQPPSGVSQAIPGLLAVAIAAVALVAGLALGFIFLRRPRK